jgi:hypothetical protein
VGVNLPLPLFPTDRCAGRFASLDEAIGECERMGEEACAGVVDDHGMQCESRFLEFELRAPSPYPTKVEEGGKGGVVAWTRVEGCEQVPPYSLPPPPSSHHRITLSPPCLPAPLSSSSPLLLAVGMIALCGWTACVWRSSRRLTLDAMQRAGISPLHDCDRL